MGTCPLEYYTKPVVGGASVPIAYRTSTLPRFGFGSCVRRHRFTIRCPIFLDADPPEKNVARRMPSDMKSVWLVPLDFPSF